MVKKLNCEESSYLNSENAQFWATVAMCFLFIGVGVPVWWKTTEVYRAVLPYDAVSLLSTEKVLQVKMTIQTVNQVSSQNFDLDAFISNLNLELNKKAADYLVDVMYQTENLQQEMFDSVEVEETALNNIKMVFQLKDVENFEIQVTNKRLIFVYLSKSNFFDEKTLRLLHSSLLTLIKDVIVDEKTLSEVVSTSYGTAVQSSNDNLKKAVKSNPNFELLFSLLCPEPEKTLAEWDIEEATSDYFNSMMLKLKPIFDFHVGSQVLYYTKIAYRPKLQQENTTSFYYITQSQLSHVINPIEAKLGSQLSSNPTLNFAVYVTERHRTPLYIKKTDNTFSQTNSFLVPRWGAMLLYNIEGVTNMQGTVHHKVEMQRVFESFLEHFRTLVGLPSFASYSVQNVMFDLPNSDGITDWELDNLMRFRSLENTASSIHTLDSLLKLLNQIKNMVINDEIAKDVYTAVNALQEAKKFSEAGNLSDFIKSSKQAFIASEKAFFDPTLLELLYFPEDQKFAIYIPLFLPVGLPLLISIIKLLKRYAEKRKVKSD